MVRSAQSSLGFLYLIKENLTHTSAGPFLVVIKKILFVFKYGRRLCMIVHLNTCIVKLYSRSLRENGHAVGTNVFAEVVHEPF